MKATGIVRRIDDLGRVVIPKEIRRTMRIREGDPLEIFTAKDGEVVFKKYSPFTDLSSFAGEYVSALHTVCDLPCVITDRDQIVAYAGPNKREFAERPLSAQAEELISARKSLGGGDLPLLKDTDKHRLAAARPILAGGDVLGMIGFLAAEGKSIGEGEEKLLQAGALFLAKQLEL